MYGKKIQMAIFTDSLIRCYKYLTSNIKTNKEQLTNPRMLYHPIGTSWVYNLTLVLLLRVGVAEWTIQKRTVIGSVSIIVKKVHIIGWIKSMIHALNTERCVKAVQSWPPRTSAFQGVGNVTNVPHQTLKLINSNL